MIVVQLTNILLGRIRGPILASLFCHETELFSLRDEFQLVSRTLASSLGKTEIPGRPTRTLDLQTIMRPLFSTLYKILIFASLSAYEAPRSRQRPERPESEPAPLPDLVPVNTQVYLADYHDASNAACTRTMIDFTGNNLELCIRLRELIGDNRVIYERFAYAPNVIVSWGARLCSDPELPNDQEYDECDAAFFCRVLTNFHPCPMSLLQEHLGQTRFRLKCGMEN